MPGTEHVTRNVIATLPGNLHKEPSKEKAFLIGAHYDSISEDPMTFAPGAVDNATGTAAVIEMALVFSKLRRRHPELSVHTMQFLLFSGEEQGYVGSKAHAAQLAERNEHHKVKLMVNLDMIGWNNPKDLTVALETLKECEPIADLFVKVAATVCSIPVAKCLKPWGSDHMAYLHKGMPAILTNNRKCEDYWYYHSMADTEDNVDQTVAEQILRLDVAVLAHYALGVAPISEAMVARLANKAKHLTSSWE